MVEGLKILICVLLLAAGIPVMAVAWLRCVVNLFRVIGHIKENKEGASFFLSLNRFNAIFVPNALDEIGREARRSVFKNVLIFVGTAAVIMGFASWAGLVST